MGRTLVLLKPDAVERHLVGEIISRIEAKGLSIAAMRMLSADVDLAEAHYEEHRDKPFFGDVVKFLTSAPSVAIVVEGPSDTWRIVRALIGATDPAEAAAGTIRGDLAASMPDNLVHGSDSPESAAREIGLFFPDLA
jgi:nucleoside-diphosphate kinase